MEKKAQDAINKCLICGDYQVEHLVEDQYWESDMHFHDYYECTLFLGGNVSFQVEDYTVDLVPNSLIMLKPNQLHRPIIRNMDAPYDRYMLRFSPALLDSISTPRLNLAACFQSQVFEPKRLPFAEKQELEAQYERLLFRVLSREFGSDILAKAALLEAIVVICRLFLKPSPDVAGLSVVRSQLTADVIQYIDGHIHENISLSDLAAEVHLSKHYLSRLFKQETNISIYKFILQKRIIYARELLIKGVSPSDVYFMCGFSDYSNFYRAFRNEYGISPREYQRNYAGGSVQLPPTPETVEPQGPPCQEPVAEVKSYW